jgi:hypothetical protein
MGRVAPNKEGDMDHKLLEKMGAESMRTKVIQILRDLMEEAKSQKEVQLLLQVHQAVNKC